MVSPPMIPGRNAATTPPNTKNSKTTTNGMASTSARCWSVAMVPVSSLANGNNPANCTSTPGSDRSSWTALKFFRMRSSLSPLSWMDMNARFFDASAMFFSRSGVLK